MECGTRLPKFRLRERLSPCTRCLTVEQQNREDFLPKEGWGSNNSCSLRLACSIAFQLQSEIRPVDSSNGLACHVVSYFAVPAFYVPLFQSFCRSTNLRRTVTVPQYDERANVNENTHKFQRSVEKMVISRSYNGNRTVINSLQVFRHTQIQAYLNPVWRSGSSEPDRLEDLTDFPDALLHLGDGCKGGKRDGREGGGEEEEAEIVPQKYTTDRRLG